MQNRAKQLTRNERTHRLCTRGAALESYLPHPELVTDEQVSTILKLLFHRSENRKIMEQVLAEKPEMSKGRTPERLEIASRAASRGFPL